jgi:8-oxo-dGTP diphosphatase
MIGQPPQRALPAKRMAAGALLMNHQGDLLIVKPTYRDDWLIPGGTIEEHESPRHACVREVWEEIGLTLTITRLLCVEYQSRDGRKSENIQFIFDGGVLTEAQIERIVIPSGELAHYRFVPYPAALELLNKKLGRRITHALHARAHQQLIYLEDGSVLEAAQET